MVPELWQWNPTFVNIFGGGNGSADIEAAVAEICSRCGVNREDMFEYCRFTALLQCG